MKLRKAIDSELCVFQANKMEYFVEKLGWDFFLSPAMDNIRTRIREEHAELFEFAYQLNRISNEKMFSVAPDANKLQELVIGVLYHRTLTSYQSSILLGESGMQAEMRAVLRVLLETTFKLVACSIKVEFAHEFIAQDYLHRRRLVNKFDRLSEDTKKALGKVSLAEELDQIEKAIGEHQIKPRSTEWFAKKAGLNDLYHSAYSMLSDAVHVGARDLERSFNIDEKGELKSIVYGPRDDGLVSQMLLAIESTILSGKALCSVLPGHLDPTLDEAHGDFVAMSEKY